MVMGLSAKAGTAGRAGPLNLHSAWASFQARAHSALRAEGPLLVEQHQANLWLQSPYGVGPTTPLR